MLYVCDFVSPRQTQNQGPLIINYLRQNAKKKKSILIKENEEREGYICH
jgi:hypothetical protein